MGPHCLDHIFAPEAVAVFGASERPESVGARVFQNLIDGGFKGGLYPINPKHAKVLDRPCYSTIAAVDGPVDLAVIAAPASAVPGIVRECGEHGVKATIVLSAGFSEALQRKTLEEAQRYRIRLVGPSCLGVIRPPRT